MNKDNKILLLAFLIIIGTVISSSINSITGRVINKRFTKLSVSPSTAYAGKNIHIGVVPGEEGVDQEAIIFNSEGVRLNSVNICSGAHRCNEDIVVNFKIPNDFKTGKYQIKIYDYSLKDFINQDFIIKGGWING